jgi:GAF domain-containing protein
MYLAYKLQLLYLAGDYQQGLEVAAQAEKKMATLLGMVATAEQVFYHALTLLALYRDAPKKQQASYKKTIAKKIRKLKKWAKSCPANFNCRYLLVEAELAAVVLNQPQHAHSLYDQAIQAAQAHGFTQIEALANELAARFFLSTAQAKFARVYLSEAHYLYLKWGAIAKVRSLEATYAAHFASWNLLSPLAHTTTSATTNKYKPAHNHSLVTTGSTTLDLQRTTNLLDVTTVTRAAQALSSEIKLDKLLQTLMQLVLENAGADRGFLILAENGHLHIAAKGIINDQESEVIVSQALALEASSSELAVSIVNYVAHTYQDVVLNDATRDGIFTSDPYILQTQPRSVLGIPITNQGRMVGLLYLENGLNTEVFTLERLTILRVLAVQGAISIENAKLYANLEQAVQELDQRNRDLLELSQAVNTVAENERASVAHELHDGVVNPFENALTQLKTKLAAGAGLSHRELEALVQEGAEVRSSLRQGLLNLHAAELKEHGLYTALIYMARRTCKDQAFKLQLELRDSLLDEEMELSENIQHAIYRITQQALQNIIKHALAHNVTIYLEVEAAEGAREEATANSVRGSSHRQLSLRITDDGRGFDVPADFNKLQAEGHNGLAGFAQKVKLLGGQLQIESRLGHGTTISMVIPLE